MGGNSSSNGQMSQHLDHETTNICRMRNPNESHGDLDDRYRSIKDIVCNNDIVVFADSSCGYCTRAQMLLAMSGYQFVTVQTTEQHRTALRELTGQSSVPTVWVKGTFVGGCNDGPRSWMGVKNILVNGKLEDLLKNSDNKIEQGNDKQ